MARFGTALVFVVLSACGSSHGRDGTDAGSGPDGAARDAGGRDGGGGVDAGRRDAGSDHWSVCETSPECVVVPASCCGTCGAATPADMIGVNESRLTDQRAEACADGSDCPGCFGVQDAMLIATCDMRTCFAIDLHTHPATACTRDDDCVLWTPTCCDCGLVTADRAIAISDTGMIAALTCDFDRPDCPPCAPSFPPELFAYCDDTSHCAVGTIMP